MDLKEYAELAQRTASTTTAQQKIGHGCLGLIGEAGEIVDIIKKWKYMGMSKDMAREKIIDELGDVCWYIAEWCAGSGMDMQSIFDGAVEITCIKLTECAVWLVESATALYNHSQSGELMRHYQLEEITYIAKCVKKICEIMRIERDAVLTHNIDKLRQRYPQGFDADRSNGRYEHG